MSGSPEVVVVADPRAALPLPSGHGLPITVWADPESALAQLSELRVRSVPAVLLLGRPDLNIPAVVMDVVHRYPEVPVLVAAANRAPGDRVGRALVREAGSEALVAATRQALRFAVQQARVRTTLDRLNVRLRTGARDQSDEGRRLFLSGLYLSSFIEQARDAMFVTDRRGTIALWNRAASSLFDCTPQEMVGRSLGECGRDAGAALSDMLLAISPATPQVSRSLSLTSPDGPRHLDVTLSLVRHPDGEAIAVSGIARDVTERAVLLAELEQRAAALEESNRAKDEFLAVLSHELRTPLNAVLGWAHILLNAPADRARVRRATETIIRNAELQRRLVEDLLDYARIAAGRLPLELHVDDVAAVVRTAAETHRPSIDAKGIHFVERYQSGLRAHLDVQRLRQVVGNLLGNAVKFTNAGGEVHLTVAGGADVVTIQVRDSGRGIGPEFLPHVFEHFRQEERATTRSEGGLGLGLAISRRIVELHGGTIEVHSEGLGRGAVFTVTLPRIEPASSSRTSHRAGPSGSRSAGKNE